MMIVAVSMVKNSADVIETMIRGNALVADKFIIINNASTDNTLDIINSLCNEGYDIEVICDESISPYQGDRVTEAARYAVSKLGADVILPLDDDEIICMDADESDPSNLKRYIGSLEQDTLYYVCWRNYIPTEEDDPAQVCVALREHFCLDDEPEMTKKVIVPAGLFQDPSFSIATGSHFTTGKTVNKQVLLKDIRLAHYPIRSSVQIASKVIVGWHNYLGMPDKDAELSSHWKVMYKAIKEYGLPTPSTMMTLANLYREHPNDTEHLNVIMKPISIPDEIFELKYTHGNEINLLKNICENAERFITGYADLISTPDRPEDV